jgi:GNAT superfamily N-acetyltransferase
LTVEVRLATRADVPVLARMRALWTQKNAGYPIEDPDYDAAFASWFEAEQHHRITWVGEVDGLVVGMLNLLVFTRMPRPGVSRSCWGYLANFFVDPAVRNSGVGRELLETCIRYADTHDFARILLSPSERSVPLYARAGFGPATEVMIRPGRPPAG